MAFVPLHEYFPELAEKETRFITVLDGTDTGLPPASYGFVEAFCNERGCDCRRVFFLVTSCARKGLQTVVAWGWEKPEFYARWMTSPDPHSIADLMGPALNTLSPQSELAPAILKLARDVLLQDPAYVERVKQHYAIFRRKIDGAKRRSLKKGRFRR